MVRNLDDSADSCHAVPYRQGTMVDLKPSLTSVIYTVTRQASVRAAADLMHSRGVGDVVVVEDSKPVGMLTDRDIVLRVTAKGLDPHKVSVQEIMTAPVITMSEEEELSNAIGLMRSHGIRRLPIVDKDGRLRSILTMDDLLFLGIAQSQLREIVRTQLRKPVQAEDSSAWADGGRRLGEGHGPGLGAVGRITQAAVAPPLGRRHRTLPEQFGRILSRNRSWMLVVALLSMAAALIALIVVFMLTPPTP